MIGPTCLLLLCALLTCTTASAPSDPWNDFNYAPASRIVYPQRIYGTNGDVEHEDSLLSADAGSPTLSGADAWVTIDFGKEVGGVVSLTIDSASGDDASFALTFAESPLLINPTLSDDSVYPVADMTSDGAQPIPGPLSKGLWTQPISWQRGGFRYLTVSLTAGDSVALYNVSVALTFSPNADYLRDYKGYFYTKDMVGEDQDCRRRSASGWNNSDQIAKVGPVIVDAAMRDRTVWPGDMGIAGPAAFVALNELEAIRNSLDEVFTLQDTTTGGLPYYGPLISIVPGESDAYHAWSLVGVCNYWMHSGDTDWLEEKRNEYKLGVAYVAGKVLTNGAAIATALGESDTAGQWLSDSASLKETINDDGNSLAVWFNVTASDEQKARISEALVVNWVDVGAVSPELPDNVAPFVGGMELHAHFEAGAAECALELIRLQWGWMLTTNVSVQSTLLEGYTSNGSLLYRGDAGYANDPSYTSHSHGWSTGPTPALTAYVLGLTVTEPAGLAFRVQPRTAGLPSAEGGFETPLGWFGVSWVNDEGNGRFELNVTSPEGTQGIVILPVAGETIVDGEEVGQEGEITVQGGTHSIVVQG
ncbi:glycoside hydrolase family 78 protein [Schizophyllum commune Tattone D]|nr:glycoside hydrolase family 78 protein [Schizophyllum commune Tattone D]